MEQSVDSGKHIIDCDVDPLIPEGLSVEEHRKGGMFRWDPAKVSLYLSEQQKGGNWRIGGYYLRKELANEPVLNANVLDYLLDHPHLIPKEWKDKYIFFWGTIYRGRGRILYVRFLCWSDGWYDNIGSLNRYRYDNEPAVVLASPPA